MKKKIFSILLCCFMFTVMVPAASLAEEGFKEARIGTTDYDTLEEAFSAAVEGDTIYLLKNITREETEGEHPVTVNTKVTLDFNGYNITVDDNMFTVEENADLTLVNADVYQSKPSAYYSDDYAFIRACKGNVTLESTSGNHILADHEFIDTIDSRGSFVVNGGTVKSKAFVVKNTLAGSEVTINGGELTGWNEEYGDETIGSIIGSCKGKFVMNRGSLISGYSAVTLYGGTAVLNGGTIKSYGSEGFVLNENSEIVVNNVEVTAKTNCIAAWGAKVTIINGTFESKSETASSVAFYDDSDGAIYSGAFYSNRACVDVKRSSATIYDGTYEITDPVHGNNCAAVLLNQSDVNIKGGQFRTEIVSTFAAVDSKLTIDGGMIFADDIGIEVDGSKVIMNGGTITTTDDEADCIFIAGNDPTRPRELTDTVTINGGTLKSDGGRYCIWNQFGHVTINNGTFEGTDELIFLQAGDNTIAGGNFTSRTNRIIRMYGSPKLVLSGGRFENKSGGNALEDYENMTIKEGYKADPEDWKELKASVVEIKPDKKADPDPNSSPDTGIDDVSSLGLPLFLGISALMAGLVFFNKKKVK